MGRGRNPRQGTGVGNVQVLCECRGGHWRVRVVREVLWAGFCCRAWAGRSGIEYEIHGSYTLIMGFLRRKSGGDDLQEQLATFSASLLSFLVGSSYSQQVLMLCIMIYLLLLF